MDGDLRALSSQPYCFGTCMLGSKAQFFLLNQGGFLFVPQFCRKGVSQIASILWSVLSCIHKFGDDASAVPGGKTEPQWF